MTYLPEDHKKFIEMQAPLLASDDSTSKKKTFSKNLQRGLAAWGVLGVISILANAIKRLFPIAMQPFVQKDLTPIHWSILWVWTIYM